MNNTQLRKELVEKLPVALRLQWGEYIEVQDDSITLASFSDRFSGKANTASNVASTRATVSGMQRNETVLTTVGR